MTGKTKKYKTTTDCYYCGTDKNLIDWSFHSVLHTQTKDDPGNPKVPYFICLKCRTRNDYHEMKMRKGESKPE